MPNHITNRLTILGSPDEVQKVFEAIGGAYDNGEPMYIDFQKIKPMPPSLNIVSGSETDVGHTLYNIAQNGIDSMEIESWIQRSLSKNLEIARLPFNDEGIARFISTERGQELYQLGKMAQENLEQYNARDWYAWCIREWGTKWNAYDQGRVDDNTIIFHTAWSGVTKLIGEIAAQYPVVEMEYMFADEDWGCNVGYYTFKGDSISGDTPANGSPEAKAIAEELLGPCWAEEDDYEIEP